MMGQLVKPYNRSKAANVAERLNVEVEDLQAIVTAAYEYFQWETHHNQAEHRRAKKVATALGFPFTTRLPGEAGP